MSVVRLPSVLRAQADGQREIEVEGTTVGAAVQSLLRSASGLGLTTST